MIVMKLLCVMLSLMLLSIVWVLKCLLMFDSVIVLLGVGLLFVCCCVSGMIDVLLLCLRIVVLCVLLFVMWVCVSLVLRFVLVSGL